MPLGRGLGGGAGRAPKLGAGRGHTGPLGVAGAGGFGKPQSIWYREWHSVIWELRKTSGVREGRAGRAHGGVGWCGPGGGRDEARRGLCRVVWARQNRAQRREPTDVLLSPRG